MKLFGDDNESEGLGAVEEASLDEELLERQPTIKIRMKSREEEAKQVQKKEKNLTMELIDHMKNLTKDSSHIVRVLMQQGGLKRSNL